MTRDVTTRDATICDAATGRATGRTAVRRRAVLGAGAAAATAAIVGRAQAQAITLNGAVQFNDDHAFTKALVRFEELVKQYYGKPINFVLHKNSALGLEKQYFEY